jgi:hypothetical protein
MDKTLEKKFLLVWLAFWLTVLGMRFVTFRILMTYHHYVCIIVHSFHIHHLFIGLGCVGTALSLLSRYKNNSFLLLILGFGAGLVSDEIGLVLARNFSPNVYWGIGSLSTLLIVGVLPFLPLAIIERANLNEGKSNINPRKKFYRFSFIPLVVSVMLLVLVFSLANPTLTQAHSLTRVKNGFRSFEYKLSKIKDIAPSLRAKLKEHSTN